MSILRFIFCGVTLLISVMADCVYADTVYFKNGFKTTGEVRETPEGYWIEGGFFKKDEIEKIERLQQKIEPEKKSWLEDLTGGMGLNKAQKQAEEKKRRDEEQLLEQKRQATLDAYNERMRRNQYSSGYDALPRAGSNRPFPNPYTIPADENSDDPSAGKDVPNILQVLQMMSGKNSNVLGQDIEDYQARQSLMLEKAYEARRQAEQRQQMMEAEVRRAEGSYMEDSTAYESIKQRPEDDSYRQNRSSSGPQAVKSNRLFKNDDDRSPLGKKMKIGNMGEVSWE